MAADEHNLLAALARYEDESLAELLARLDAAVAAAFDDDCIDEINA